MSEFRIVYSYIEDFFGQEITHTLEDIFTGTREEMLEHVRELRDEGFFDIDVYEMVAE